MKVLLVFVSMFAFANPALADTLLKCKSVLRNGVFKPVNELFAEIEVSQGNKLSQFGRVRTLTHDYGWMELYPNSTYNAAGKIASIAFLPTKHFKSFGFVAQTTVVNKPNTFSGTMDVVFRGPFMPPEGTSDQEPGVEYFEERIDCVLE